MAPQIFLTFVTVFLLQVSVMSSLHGFVIHGRKSNWLNESLDVTPANREYEAENRQAWQLG